ncbi:MAG: heavy metal-responsive transcriptional regulator [Candidatus Dormibacteria bacterium]
MTIGQLAKQVGVNVQTVRFYERRGLLPDPTRKESGYRIYSPDDLHRLRFIRHAKTLGFSLNEIATILRMREKGKCPCGEVTKIGEGHLQDLEEQIERLQRFHAELSRAVKTWKRLGEQRVSADAICVLIERTMDGAGKKERK